MKKDIIYINLVDKRLIAVKQDIFNIPYYEIWNKDTQELLICVDPIMIEGKPTWIKDEEPANEPRPTILSFRNRATGTLLVLTTPDTYRANFKYNPIEVGMTTQQCIDTPVLEIYQVQRQTDSEIFTVGDMTDKGQITAFKAIGKTIGAKINGGIEMSLNGLKKQRKPILTTADDVDIYDPATKLYSYNVETGEQNTFQPERTKLVDGWLHFTSPDTRKAYLVANMKIFSYYDIMSILTILMNPAPGEKIDNEIRTVFYDIAEEAYPYED